MKTSLIRLTLLPVALCAWAAALHAAGVTLAAPDSLRLRFALGKLESALQQRGDAMKRRPLDGATAQPDVVVLIADGAALSPGPEGFSLARRDERGAMYGVLDVAEQIRAGTPWNQIQERTVKAQFEFRALKFNLPWSAYRTSPALEQHQATCKDLRYWEAFLDMMAENRFNVLSLWSLHPYTYMIRPKNFPEACPFNDAELAEWKKLWSGIFAMAKERGIETYLLNWNIFVSPEFSRAHNAAPWSASLSHIGKESETNALVTRYTREVVTQVLDEYPDLFIVHGGKLSDAYWNPPPTRHKVVWTMRSEDLFILRWGQPDFVREFIQRQGAKDYVGGAIIGSECYIPALDYMTKEGPHKTWRWAFERQWLFYTVWGRLLYEGATPDRVFVALLEERFGAGLGEELLQAWKLASQVPLHFASFHRGTWDGSLYTEGFSSWIDRDDGARTFFGIDAFINHPVLDTKRYVNIADFVKAGGVAEPGKLTPLALAAQLDRDGAEALRRVAGIRARTTPSPTLECELADIEAWVAYGSYFAEKLRAGVAFATARAKNDAKQQAVAISALERALAHWKRLAELGGTFNRLPVPSNSKEPLSWTSLTPVVERDIEMSRKTLGERKTESAPKR